MRCAGGSTFGSEKMVITIADAAGSIATIHRCCAMKPEYFLIAALILVSPAAATVIAAHGDGITISGTNAPSFIYMATGDATTILYDEANTTIKNQMRINSTGRLWLFGTEASLDSIYGREFNTTGTSYSMTINRTEVWNLAEGNYTLLFQFPGKNGVYDISHTSNPYIEKEELTTIYKECSKWVTTGCVPTVDVTNYAPSVTFAKLLDIAAYPQVDDIFIKDELMVRDPIFKVTNMYDTEDGDLYLGGVTNLAAGTRIDGYIDEQYYSIKNPPTFMHYTTKAAGNDPTKMRTWMMLFSRNAAINLNPSKTHIISIRYFESGLTTIPFTTYTREIIPTPIPTLERRYSITGNLLGYEINNTRPSASEISENATGQNIAASNYETVLADVRLGNRTIYQRDKVYLGEKNLNILPAIGWADPETGNWYLSYNEKTILIEQPIHFNADESKYWDKLGDWYQYDPKGDYSKAPIAFTLEKPRFVQLSNTTPLAVTTANTTPEPEPPTEYTPEPTPAVLPTPAPAEPQYPPGAMIVPLPHWLAWLAVFVAAGIATHKRF